ncbi:SET family sugar efflux transporter-like MFS transporter [Serratia fonticola]|uniref:SET family sugar efflux transporter-like MFS transporter n=1 Tax=Serratia fonticola TaxID=47917 RepID=A0A542D806_SERFO|nr:sugar efflux transporter [Serratia fonticola]TQI78823.1 SET family sugar efflux transporter-like MFS transporter [Serratia fonticola]TQI99154.1 SET family sugar efflux transporter-like MFS transporter [Serratia fonticola]TVZ68679.1 SET family sugar efflux transporter-like MFS transporter [Serratia fonticola]
MNFTRWLPRRFNPVFAAFLIIAFLTGIAGALQAPTLSLFLTTEVKVRPLWVGMFYTVNAIAGIIVSFLLAKRSDTRGDRRKLILLCCMMAVGNSLLFAFNRDYLTLITAGVLLAAIANTAMPQIFALAREYADSSAREVVMFSSVMRAQLSLAWVIGPPLSFMLALNYGFTVMFIIAAVIFGISVLLVWLILPSVPRAQVEISVDAPPIAPIGAWRDPDVRLLFIASMLMWTCNTMYIIDMPLYITADLGLPERLAGLLMGTAAGLEIPAMLLAGYYVKRFGKRNMMLFAVAAGVLFYAGLVLFKFKLALMVLQLFNAIFIGIIAGIGMLYFQDLMPGRPGAATTMFTNSISTGVILAGVLQGVLVENLGHYAVYWLITLLAGLALWMCARVREV